MSSNSDVRVGPTAADARQVIGLIDLTDLSDDHSPDGIDLLVVRAIECGAPAVCVWPEFVSRVIELRRSAKNATLKIATVVNFPHGSTDAVAAAREAAVAIADGADEIDLVMPYRALLAGDEGAVTNVLAEVAAVVNEADDVHLKVILETGELRDETVIRRAARLAISAGADFVKSSTGKTDRSATLGSVAAMIDAIVESGRTVGVKPSGGIRTVADALPYLDLVTDRLGVGAVNPDRLRFGASGLLNDALRTIDSQR
jgi:deoxyribose-phosphate aldolase